MDKYSIPDWAKKWGKTGLLTFLALSATLFFMEAILQQEAQSLWEDNIKPALLSPYEVKLEMPVWVWVLSLAMAGAAIYLGYEFLTKPKRVEKGKINLTSALKSEKPDPKNQSRVFRAVYEARKHRLSADDLAKIIEQSVNVGSLKSEIGSDILKEFGYVLLLNADKTVTAARDWRAQ
jgi:hypothetical protein